ncbi:MAG: Gfo/Idh/MocA family oxidoreductase [Gemmatimonadota bacterium]|nr:Gfo/Idh/MocA family oxidoreductase [Gemmatimonadota bacterium]
MPSRRDFLLSSTGSLAAMAILPDPAWFRPYRTAVPVKVGIVGMGRHGRAIAAELQKIEGVEIATICEIVPERLRVNVERIAGSEGFADLATMLNRRPEVRAIIVATPTHLHREPVEMALQAGRHVYVEAPLAHTPAECRAIVAAGRSVADQVVMAGFPGRSNPLYQRARTLFRTDSVRDPVALTGQNHRKTSWRFPVTAGTTERSTNWRLDPEVSPGLAGELGALQFDVAHWYRGRTPVSVSGRGAIRFHKDGRAVPDTVLATLAWDDDVTMTWDATLASSFGGQFEVFSGVNAALKLAWTHGWMFKETDAPTQGWEVYATRQQFHTEEGITLVANATQLAAQGLLKEGAGLPYPALYYPLADFIRAVTEGNAPTTTLEDGARSTIVGLLANRAIITGQTIPIPEDPLTAD